MRFGLICTLLPLYVSTFVACGPAPRTLPAAGPVPAVSDAPPARLALGGHAEPAGELRLQDALEATLAGSPELSAFSWTLKASDAHVLQAGLLPNPDLSVEAENFVGSGDFSDRRQFQNTLQLSQLIELGSKREKRTEAAARARDRAAIEYEAKRAEVLSATTIDFIGTVGDQEALGLARLASSYAAALLATVQRRLREGVSSPLEEKRARIAVARARIAEHHAGHQLLTSKTRLAAHWGSKTPVFADVRADLYTTRPVPPLEGLLECLDSSPERRVAVAEKKLREAELALARTKRIPDVVGSVGWRQGRTWDDQAAVAGLTVPLPLFNRSQGDVAASQALVEKAQVDSSAAETRLRSVLFGLYQEIVHARDEVEAMRGEILPRAEESLSLARQGFERGLFGQLDLLEAQRTLVEVRAEYIQAAVTYHQLVAEVERLLGGPL
jgi:cobalt-zinc-cadmium efflux system outer membrane protein